MVSVASSMDCGYVHLTTTKTKDVAQHGDDTPTPANRLTQAYSLGLQHTYLTWDVMIS